MKKIVFILLFLLFVIVGVALLASLNEKLYAPGKIWDIALFRIPSSTNILEYDYSTPDIVFSPRSHIRYKKHYVTGYADPYLFVKDDYLYLFYEKELYKAPASICAKRTKDLESWEDLGVVLHEPFHLSYPCVFEYSGQIYMMPETKDIESVVLYKAVDFPTTWQHDTTLLFGDKFVDSCILRKDDRFFLFTTSWRSLSSGLLLFSADSLKGPYKELDMSPLSKDYSNMRCAGAVFHYDNHYYRPAQFDVNYYGENLAIFQIDSISSCFYHESQYRLMIDHNNSWSTLGGHHYNVVNYHGEQVVVMDGRVKDNWINNRTRRFFGDNR